MISISTASRTWSIMRICAISIMIAIILVETVKAYCHVIDIKLPSSQAENLKWEEKENQNKKGYDKVQKALDENWKNIESGKDDGGSSRNDWEPQDYSNYIDYQENHCG
jgi:hypothetical protein